MEFKSNNINVNISNYDDRPFTPPLEECCGNGCNPCILDVHKRILSELHNKENVSKETTKYNLLSPISYKTFVLKNIKRISDDSVLILLCCDGEADTYKLLIDPGQHIILRVKSISRPFTPISWSEQNITLLIKLYPNGKFSTYLNDARIGDKIDVRGPYGDFKYIRNSFQRVFMFSIGSGIAALYPVAKAIVDNECEETLVHIVAGFRSINHISLKNELRCLSDYWNFKCTLCISQKSENNVHGLNVKYGRMNELLVKNLLQCGNQEKTLILICGTSQFNRTFKEWMEKLNYSHVHVFE